jgi:hypothetical protein
VHTVEDDTRRCESHTQPVAMTPRGQNAGSIVDEDAYQPTQQPLAYDVRASWSGNGHHPQRKETPSRGGRAVRTTSCSWCAASLPSARVGERKMTR